MSRDEFGHGFITGLMIVNFDVVLAFVKGGVSNNEDGCLVIIMHRHFWCQVMRLSLAYIQWLVVNL